MVEGENYWTKMSTAICVESLQPILPDVAGFCAENVVVKIFYSTFRHSYTGRTVYVSSYQPYDDLCRLHEISDIVTVKPIDNNLSFSLSHLIFCHAQYMALSMVVHAH